MPNTSWVGFALYLLSLFTVAGLPPRDSPVPRAEKLPSAPRRDRELGFPSSSLPQREARPCVFAEGVGRWSRKGSVHVGVRQRGSTQSLTSPAHTAVGVPPHADRIPFQRRQVSGVLKHD